MWEGICSGMRITWHNERAFTDPLGKSKPRPDMPGKSQTNRSNTKQLS